MDKIWRGITDGMQAIHEFWLASSNYGSLAAGVLAVFISAFFLFQLKERRVPASRFCGVFYVRTTTLSSAYNPFLNLRVFRTIVIFTDGNVVHGTSEITGEINKDGPVEHIGDKRTRGIVTGRIERNYTRGSKLHLQIVEAGRRRESTIHFEVPIAFFEKKGKLRGDFYSTAADSSGKLRWKRKKFKGHPSKSSLTLYPSWFYL